MSGAYRRGSMLALVCVVAVVGCASRGPAPVPELIPGMLVGYLAEDELPDSLALVPPPPEEGSAAFARDVEAAADTFALRGTERWRQAIADADLMFPEVTAAFNEAIGFAISEERTPYLYRVMRRTAADAGLSTYTAKNHYQRERPFMVNGRPICTPDDEDMLRKDGSYPSGHTAIGWAWALIFCEIVPERTDELLQRGYEFGYSRMICNVHWQSDTDAGRLMGAAAVARLHADREFRADLEKASKEARRMLAR